MNEVLKKKNIRFQKKKKKNETGKARENNEIDAMYFFLSEFTDAIFFFI